MILFFQMKKYFLRKSYLRIPFFQKGINIIEGRKVENSLNLIEEWQWARLRAEEAEFFPAADITLLLPR